MAPRSPPKRDLKAEAEAALAAFREKGGAVKQMPTVVPTAFGCRNCGHTGVIGIREGQRIRCPKCREFVT